MCGRIARTSSRPVIIAEFGVSQFADVDLAPRYNVAPSQNVEAIVRVGDDLRLGPMRWGFEGAGQASQKPINARAESVAGSKMFGEAFRRRRCLVVADGFYEWRKQDRITTPYFIHLRSRRPFGLAGIWSSRINPDGRKVATCAILTCPPNQLMAGIHNRMPVIVDPANRSRWLDPEASVVDLRSLLTPFPSDALEAYEVSSFVNSPRNDAAQCIEPV